MSLERLLNNSLEVLDLFGVGQLGEHVFPGVALPGYVVHLKAFEVVDESFGDVIVLEQHYFLVQLSVGNLPLDKLRVGVSL